MKYFFALIFLLFQIPAFGIEEVILDVDDNTFPEYVVKGENNKGLTLREKIENIKAKEITDTNNSSFLLEDVLTKKFETGIIETMHVFGYYRGAADINVSSGGDTVYDFSAIQAGINGKFRGGKNYYEARLRFNPIDGYSFLQTLPVDIYVANASIPHHTIIFGNTRTPVGYEGALSDSVIPFVARAQISRNFGNIRKVGMRVKGNYDLIDYDLGGYSSDTYFREFFPGVEFAGWVNIKPLGKTNGKYGKLNVGGGVTAGNNTIDYCVSGLYAGYEYKNFMANFEYASADGYNGVVGLSSNKAEGFYSTVGYKISPKLQVLGRYDQYTPNKNFSNDIRREYSVGFNYFIKGQALKLMLNYVFCQNDLIEDSHRIILGTQILL